MEIKPLEGVGEVRFGMNPSQVKAIMGTHPTYEEWMGGNLNDSLCYPSVIFSFNRCNSRKPLPFSSLNYIRIYAPSNLTLWEKPVLEWTRDDIVHYCYERGLQLSSGAETDLLLPHLGLELAFEGEQEQLQWLDLDPR